MKQISTEFESQRFEEDRRERRRVTMARVRRAIAPLMLLGAFGTVYVLRGDIEHIVVTKFCAPPAAEASATTPAATTSTTPTAAATSSIAKAQENAKLRDALIDGTAK